VSEIKSGKPLAALSIPHFRNFIIGRFLFIMSLRMMGTLVGWWVYELTGDPLALGLIGLSEVIPAVSMALYAGHIVDLNDRKKMIIRSVTAYTICLALLFLIAVLHANNQTLKLQIIVSIFLIIFCGGLIRAFSGPSFGATIGHLVPQSLLPNATAWSQGSWLIASVIGHGLVGFLIAGLGIAVSLGIILSLCSIALMIFFRLPNIPPPPSVETKTWERVKEGLQFVWKTKTLLAAMSLDLFAVLLGGAVAMLPVFAKDILNVGPVGFGWLNAAGDLGAILVVTSLLILPLSKNQGKILMITVFGFGASIVVFGLSTSFWLSLFALFMGGVLDGFSIVIRGTILQLQTPAHLRGRVLSVNSMFINSSNELGQFESGVAARIFGTVPSVVIGGCMTMVVAAISWFKAKELRKLQY
jgi:MFS family permease